MNSVKKKRKKFNKKYLLESSVRISRISRLIAKGIDLFLALLLAILFYPLGLILALIYISLSDALQNGQSIGKRFIGFCVISLEDGTPCSAKQSFIRNLPFLVPMFFALIPGWGWIFSLLVGLPLMALELYLLFKLDSGHRLGDVMADTTVIGNDPSRVDLRKKKETWFPSGTSVSCI